MASIHEETSIQGQQAIQFFPKEHFNVPKSTIQKTKTVITSLNSGIVTKDFKNTASTPYTFVITPNNMSIFDLSQCYFNIAGDLQLPEGYHLTDFISFGNLFISSLFQNATLTIGGVDIALNSFPGLDANLQASLKYDNYDLKSFGLADRQFMVNDIDYDISISHKAVTFAATKFLIKGLNGTTSASGRTDEPLYEHRNEYIYYHNATGVNVSTHCTAAKDIVIKFDDSGNGVMYISNCTNTDNMNDEASVEITLAANSTSIYAHDDSVQNMDKNSVITPQDTFISGTIPFRCKLYLSDLFNYTVDSLDYIFNREISITLTRSSNSFIIANVLSPQGNEKTNLEVASTSKFELIAFSYLLTDTARNQLIQFYNRPVETLYGVQTMNVTPFVQNSSAVEQTITLPMPVTYDTKCILICIPKCSNVLQALSTPLGKQSEKGQFAAGTYKSSWYMSNSNSYNYGGLRYIRIYNTNNSNIYTYDFSGTKEEILHPTQFIQSFDINNAVEGSKSAIPDYREAYEQYKQLRLLFGKSPDNALDYWTYLKDYCVIPIDLTGTNIPPNTRVYISLQFENWANNYNPLHYGNLKTNNYLSTNIMCVFLGRNVLLYKPDGGCEVKNVLSANPVGKEYKLN